MHVGEIIFADSANGTGIRVSLFVSGCTNHCPGCFQPQTWDFGYGRLYDGQMEQQILDELAKPYYDGLTILGGEPFELANQAELLPLIRRLRSELPTRSIWMYSGFVYDRDLVPGGRRYGPCTDEILDSIDVLVDGPFIQEKRNIALNFRGSENQRILDMRQTRAAGRPVMSPLNENSRQRKSME